jgi:hypothetical protein
MTQVIRESEFRWYRRDRGAWESYGVVAAAATGLLRGPLRFRPLRGPAAPPYTSLDLARSTRLKDPDESPAMRTQPPKQKGSLGPEADRSAPRVERCLLSLLPRARRACLDSHNGGRR